ncbi:Ig-like domain-containing protein [Vibrio neptunius]|uniref:Ig-like domain-containing protein n=1 Tax=Vibrio neptunius TaxID=170651 RepID=UPI001F09566C|nr:Ig-like domain-containing protein [Vibrio neptunius]
MDKRFNFKDLLLLMALTLVVLLLSGCGGSEEEGASQTESSPPQSTPSTTRPEPSQIEAIAQLERLTLTAFPFKTKGTSELTLITGNEQYFLAVGEYSNGRSKVLTEELSTSDWQSSDTDLGEFIQSGVLKGKASGAVAVSFSKGNLTSNPVEVNVTDATITDITITPSAVSVAKGYHQPLTATATYNNGLSVNISDSVTWMSNDTSTATVTTKNDHGLLKGGNVGSTTITAMKEGVTSNTVNVDVTNAVITAISVTPPTVTVAKGQNQSLQAKATYSDGTSSMISDSVTWIPNDSSIANVTYQGLLAGGKVGATTLTAMKDGVTSNTVNLDVTNAVLSSINVTPTTLTVAKGQTEPLTAMAIYSDGTTANISNFVTWKPVDATTANINTNGVLAGGLVGTTTVTAIKEGVTSNTVNVDVTNAVITAISVTPPTVTVAKGQNQSLQAKATYSDGTSSMISDSVTWIPNDSSIANVTYQGLLAGGKVGATTLTAMKDGVTSNTVNLDVTNAVLSSINVTPTTLTVAKGQTEPLTAMAIYSDGTTANISDSVSWRPVDNHTATVTPSGVLSGGKVGTTTLTALKDGITSNTVNVDVTNAVITAISVTPPTVTVARGHNQALAANATYSDGTSSDISGSVSWMPVERNTATVTSNGLLTGAKVGTTTLTAVKDGVTSNSVGVVVSDAVITAISVTPPTVTVARGQNQRLTANATYSDGTSSDISGSVSWMPIDSSTATVSSDGLLAGGKVGVTTLTAVKDGISSNTVDVDVTNAVITAINVTPPTLSVAKGQSEPLTATATYSDNTSSDISDSVSWRPVDNHTATVTPSSLLSGSKVGTTTLTAVKDGVTSNSVNVDVTNAVITAISVTPSTVQVAKGQKQPLAANATYSDGTSSDISGSVSWIPVERNTATVTSNGLLTGAKVGTTTLTAVKDGVTSNPVGVVVTDAVITAISVTPPNVTLAKGNNQPLTATATYSDLTSSDISRFVTWAPSDSSTATVTFEGLLTGANFGTTSVTAAKDGVTSNTVNVDVSNAEITALRVTPTIISVAHGQNVPLTATATYSDGTSSDVTRSVTWTSSRSMTSAGKLPIGFTGGTYQIVTVTPQGLLTGVAVGPTTVSATINGVTSNIVDVGVTRAVITDIRVTPTRVSVAKGHSQPLTARATYSDGTTSDISDSVTWLPLDSTATVTAQGLLSGSRVGTTTLTAVKDGITSNTVDVDVTNAVITGIRVTPTTLSVAKGHNQPLTATATYSDNSSSDISGSVSWIPVDSNTATVTAHGLLSGADVGTTTVTAAKDGVTSNTVDVDVTNAVMTGLSLHPPAIGVLKGQTQPLTAIATYSDGTSSNISGSVTWWTPVIENTRTATVSAKGLVKGVNQGSSTVTASVNGFTSNSVYINVCNDNNNDLKGKCIDLLNTGNGKLFTNTPSVAYLNSIGLRGVNSIYMSHYYTFTQRNARALCAQYNTKHLGGRTNWRLPTVNELKNELYRSNQLMSWQVDRNYWSSSERTSVNLRYNQTSTRPNLFFASCVSEP